jgi:hypothetical protein
LLDGHGYKYVIFTLVLLEFIEEGGIDCISENREELGHCFNALAEMKNNTMALQTSEQICG